MDCISDGMALLLVFFFFHLKVIMYELCCAYKMFAEA